MAVQLPVVVVGGSSGQRIISGNGIEALSLPLSLLMHHHHGWDWGRDSLALLRNNHVNFFSFSCWWCISFFRCQQSRAMCQLVLWMRKQVYYQIWLCRQGRLELWQGAGVVKLSFYRSNPGERTTVPAGIPYSTQHITHIFHIPHIYSHTNRSSPGERLTGYHKWIQMRKFPAPRKSREIVLCENTILPSSFTASAIYQTLPLGSKRFHFFSK